MTLGVVWGEEDAPVWSQELDSMIHMGPFQLEMFYDSMTCVNGVWGMWPWAEQGSEELCDPNVGGCVGFTKRTRRDVSSQTMLLAMPHTGQAVFSCLQAACLSVHSAPSTIVQTTAFSSKKCSRYHYGQMFIQWSPQEILMLNYCPVFASKYTTSVSWWAVSKGISIKMIPRG